VLAGALVSALHPASTCVLCLLSLSGWCSSRAVIKRIVGAQITPGTYRAADRRQGCFWQRVSSFTGGADAIIANALANSDGAQLAIASTDAGFSANQQCGTWARVP